MHCNPNIAFVYGNIPLLIQSGYITTLFYTIYLLLYYIILNIIFMYFFNFITLYIIMTIHVYKYIYEIHI
jgi:hypothetical protein